MAVDLLGYSKMEDQMAIQEAATAGLRSMEHLIHTLSHQTHQQNLNLNQLDCREITDFTVAKFKKVISILNRTGHARFRRGPASSSSSPITQTEIPQVRIIPAPAPQIQRFSPVIPQSQPLTLDFTKPNLVKPTPLHSEASTVSTSQFTTSNTSSLT
ncbi:hypothetical protein ACHQM5_011568 [Ranunculus cassubicifolius]